VPHNRISKVTSVLPLASVAGVFGSLGLFFNAVD